MTTTCWILSENGGGGGGGGGGFVVPPPHPPEFSSNPIANRNTTPVTYANDFAARIFALPTRKAPRSGRAPSALLAATPLTLIPKPGLPRPTQAHFDSCAFRNTAGRHFERSGPTRLLQSSLLR